MEKKISHLVVDDDDKIKKLNKTILIEKKGFVVSTAINSEDAKKY